MAAPTDVVEAPAKTTPVYAPPPSAAANTTAAPSAANDASQPPAQSWADKLCGAGPHPAPLAGTVKATALPNSDPKTLDPKDTGYHLYEGAVWFDGALHFSDFKTTAGFPSRILSYKDGKLQVVVPDSGSNGLGLDPTGAHLTAARHSTKSVSVLKDGSFQQLAAAYEGQPFNSPNDLVYRSDGNLYFTDPAFQAGDHPTQPTTNVYRVAPDGAVSVIDSSIKNPNGVTLSPDENTLYVAGNLEQGYVKQYPIAADGSVGDGTVLLDKVTVPDGMVVDCAGNLYVTEHTKKRVRVIDASGKELGQLNGMDINVTNVAFGGPEHKTLFITGTGKLFQVELPVVGLPY